MAYGLNNVLYAQIHSDYCGTRHQTSTSTSGNSTQGVGTNQILDTTVKAGPYKALVVYVRFKDDNADSPGWLPFDRTSPPSFASKLISSSTNPANFPEKSVTKYFYEQSNPGNPLILYGDTYPQVVVTDEDEDWYYSNDAPGSTNIRWNRGWGYLSMEVLNKINPNINFADYDKNNDGDIDFIYMVVRGNPKRSTSAPFSGILGLQTSNGYEEWFPTSTTWTSDVPNLSFDGKNFKWYNGSIIMNGRPGNVDPEMYHTPLWAHEYGHSIFDNNILGAGHTVRIGYDIDDINVNGTFISGYRILPFIPALDDKTRFLPFYDPNSYACIQSWRQCFYPNQKIGFTLMAGDGNQAGGSAIVSAYESSLLGWTNCQLLSASQNNVVVKDFYKHKDCFRINTGFEGEHFNGLDINESNYNLIVSNLQRTNPFSQLKRVDIGNNLFADLGLMTQGLSIGASIVGAPGYASLLADNDSKITIDTTGYINDLYTPFKYNQLTPWTRPNINVNSFYGENFRGKRELEPGAIIYFISWKAIDNIRYTGGADGEMAFDYVEDFRTRPVIRSNSYIGKESHNQTLTGKLLVKNGAILEINSGSSSQVVLNLAQGLEVEQGATLRIKGNVKLNFLNGSNLVLKGKFENATASPLFNQNATLTVNAPIMVEPTATFASFVYTGGGSESYYPPFKNANFRFSGNGAFIIKGGFTGTNLSFAGEAGQVWAGIQFQNSVNISYPPLINLSNSVIEHVGNNGIQFLYGTLVTFQNNQVKNIASNATGCILCVTDAMPLIKANILHNGTATSGSAISVSGSAVYIEENTIYAKNGVGIFSANGAYPLVKKNTIVTENSNASGIQASTGSFVDFWFDESAPSLNRFEGPGKSITASGASVAVFAQGSQYMGGQSYFCSTGAVDLIASNGAQIYANRNYWRTGSPTGRTQTSSGGGVSTAPSLSGDCTTPPNYAPYQGGGGAAKGAIVQKEGELSPETEALMALMRKKQFNEAWTNVKALLVSEPNSKETGLWLGITGNIYRKTTSPEIITYLATQSTENAKMVLARIYASQESGKEKALALALDLGKGQSDDALLTAAYLYLKFEETDKAFVILETLKNRSTEESVLTLINRWLGGEFSENDYKRHQNNETPTELTVSQYPNPFQTQAVFEMALPKTTNVSLKIFDILGKEVAVVTSQVYEAGVHQLNFNTHLASGTYIWRLEADGQVKSNKMLVIR